MVKTPFGSTGRSLHTLGLILLNLPTRLTLLAHRGPAFALLAGAMAAASALCAGPGPLRPAAVVTPAPSAELARQMTELAQPRYLASRRSPPGTLPEQASSRGERPTPTPPAAATPPASATPPAPPATPVPRGIIALEVSRGDSLAGLARLFGVTPETIAWANGLDVDAALQPGQVLTILPVSGVLHTVRRGETLNDIAAAYGVDAAAIAATNNLAGLDDLRVDQALVIPGGRPLPSPTPTATPEPTPTETPEATATPQLTAAEAPTPTAEPQPTPAGDVAAPEASSKDKGAEIVAVAVQYLGYPYVYGGSSPGTGFDCSGFAQYVYAQAGISLPRTAAEQAFAGPAVARSDLQPGDLITFAGTYGAGISHVGIYVGDGQMIHASTPGRGVCYDAIDDAYWVAHYYGACRPW